MPPTVFTEVKPATFAGGASAARRARAVTSARRETKRRFMAVGKVGRLSCRRRGAVGGRSGVCKTDALQTSSVELPRGLPRVAVGEGRRDGLGGCEVLAVEQHGAALRGVGGERLREHRGGLFFCERFQRLHGGLAAVP